MSVNPFEAPPPPAPAGNPFVTGMEGSQTIDSQANATQQRKPPVANGKESPWQAFGASSAQWNQIHTNAKSKALDAYTRGGAPPPPAFGALSSHPITSTAKPGPVAPPPAGGGKPAPYVPVEGDQPWTSTNPPPPQGGRDTNTKGIQSGPGLTTPTTHQMVNNAVPPHAVNPGPADGTDIATWAQQHSQFPGYQILATDQGRQIAEEYFRDAYAADASGEQGIDFTDWFMGKHANLASPEMQANYKKKFGYDSYFFGPDGNMRNYFGGASIGGGSSYTNPADEPLDVTAQRYMQNAPGYYGQGVNPQQVGQTITEYRNFAITNGIQNMDYVDWLAKVHPDMLGPDAAKYIGRTSGGVNTYDYEPSNDAYGPKWVKRTLPPTTNTQGGGGGNGGGGNPPVISNDPQVVLPPGGNNPGAISPGPPQQNPPPGGSGGGAPPPPAADGGSQPNLAAGSSDLQQLRQYLSSFLRPGDQRAMSEMNRTLRAEAGHSGLIRSGGFLGGTLANADAALAGQQSGKMADILATASESEKKRLSDWRIANLQSETARYGIDANKAVAEMNDATARFGITTNADLQRWLNDASSNTLAKYGIDQKTFMDKYQADMSLHGQEISANAQVSAASMQAAAQAAIAQANREAANLNSQRNYDLGVLGLNEDVWKVNTQAYQAYLNLLMLLSPEERARLGDIGNLPGYTVGGG